MKLWQYLQKKMAPYAERIAFARAGVTYADLLAYATGDSGGKLVLCSGSSREEQALAILRCIAGGNVAVPASMEYGKQLFAEMERTVQFSEEIFTDLAFLMFTSGTTGKPKGVMLTDENIIANLEGIASYFRLEGMKRICIARPLLHIAVLTGELLYALCCGLTIHFYEEPFMPQRLLSFLYKNDIDVFCATPTLYTALAQTIKKEQKPFLVKVAALSGEVLEEKTGEFLTRNLPETSFYNVYGLTEHSPRVSALAPGEFRIRPNSIGKAIHGVTMKIEQGELLVRSPCVMRGYFHDKDATEKKIVNGWLHTGDMAHTDAEGFYYIDGRKDDMIIRAGLNIYPVEIEAAARTCAGVDDCVVYGKSSEKGGTEIVIEYIGTAEPLKLRRILTGCLDPHKMPNIFIKKEKLECTPSGKKLHKQKTK